MKIDIYLYTGAIGLLIILALVIGDGAGRHAHAIEPCQPFPACKLTPELTVWPVTPVVP